MLVANFVAHCLWRHARHDGLLYACSAEERSLVVRPGEKLGVWAEVHDQYSPAARCRSKLRFWVSLVYVFICEECRGMRTLSARRHPVRFFTRTSGLAACRRNDFLPDRYICLSRSSEMSSPV